MTTDDRHDPDALDALVQVPTSHYEHGYDTLERFQSYWHQLREATGLGGRILEIGIGNGTVSSVLRARGLDVVTTDIDRELRPDVVADIRKLPFEDGSFDGVLACEILEHIPWDDLPLAFRELRRVARSWVVFSVPSVGPAAALQASLPNAVHVLRMIICRRWPLRDGMWALTQRAVWTRAGGKVRHVGAVDPLRRRHHVFKGEHYWVLGEGGLVAGDVRTLVTNSGFTIVREFRPAGSVSHQFFVLTGAQEHASGPLA